MFRFILLSALLMPGLFASGAASGFDIMQFIPILLIFIIFYFLILRPQQKKARVHQEMLKALHKGDRVVTSGGIFGTVDKIINDSEISIEIADNVKIKVLKSSVSDVITRTPQSITASKGTIEKKTVGEKDGSEKVLTAADPAKETDTKPAAASHKKKAPAAKKAK